MIGGFASPTDVDVYQVLIPNDAPVEAGNRAHLDAWLQPVGVGDGLYGGNGATTTAKAWLVDAETSLTVASLDQTDFDVDAGSDPAALYAPVALGKTYLLHVGHSGDALGARPHYVIRMAVGTTYALPVETADTTNDSTATAEALTPVEDGYYGVSGDLAPATADVFSMAVPSGTTLVGATCAAARAGSGLQGFSFDVLTAEGATVASTQETAQATATVEAAVPAGQTTLLLRVQATGQDGEVTGTYYECGMSFYTE